MRFLSIVYLLFLAHLNYGQLSKGEIIDSVKVGGKSEHTYALYLPKSYDAKTKWPIIYFFEPAARGALPVELYSEVAEKHGFILVASNNSRNHMLMNESLRLAQELFDDTHERFSVDSNFILTSGFSGGSRLAITIAGLTSEIIGVIGIGAATPVPGYQIPDRQDFLYVGLVGNLDMNYQEHKRMREHLDNIGVKNWLVISNIRHQWAASEEFELAYLWIEARHGVGNLADLKQKVIRRNRILQDSVSYCDLVILQKGLDIDGELEKQTKEYQKAIKNDGRIREREIRIRKQVRDSLDKIIFLQNTETLEWIKSQGRDFNRRSENRKQMEQAHMYVRLFEFLTSYSYERMISNFMAGNFEKVHILIDVLETVQQGNAWLKWWRAKAYSMQGEVDKCVESLEQLISEDILNWSLLNNDSSFDPIRDSKLFTEFEEKLSD